MIADPNKNLEEEINKLCRQIVDEKGYKTFRDIDTKVMPDMMVLGAFISFLDRKITTMVGQDFYGAVDKVIEQEGLGTSSDSFIPTALYTIVTHEYNHHWECPINKENMQLILEGLFESINGREYRKDRIIQGCLDVSNMFSDTIINTIAAHTDIDKNRYRQGLDLTYLLMGNYTKRKAKQKGDKAFTLFLNTNQALCQTSPQMNEKMQKYLASFFLGHERYKRKVLDIFTGDETLTKAVLSRDVGSQAAADLVGRLRNVSEWKHMAKEYADIIYPFLKKRNEWLDNSFTRRQQGQNSQQGPQQSSGQQQSPQQSSDSKQKKQESSSSGDSQQKKPEQNKDDKNKSLSSQDKKKQEEKSANEKKDERKQSAGKKDDKNEKKSAAEELLDKLFEKDEKNAYKSPFVHQFYLLDELYKKRAGKISLFAHDNKRTSPEHEIYLGKDVMPFDEFRSKDIDWASTRIFTGKDGEKSFELYRRDLPITLPFESEMSDKGIPDLGFIIDGSISMDFKPFEGDGVGEYHLAVLTFYSMLNDLEQKGVAPLINYLAMNFGLPGDTRSSGWRTYSEIDEVKKTLFDYPSAGGTYIDRKALADFRLDRKDNCLLFMLSDTMFSSPENTLEIISEVDEMLGSGGIGLYLFQIGSKTPFSIAMEDRGVGVNYIESAQDFLDQTIIFTRDLYAEATK